MSILVVGSLNMDLVTYVDKMPKGGETVNGISFAQYCGGKGANQAIAIGKLNGKVSMLGKVGNDSYGEILLSALKDSNVSSYVNKKDNVSTGIASIIVEESMKIESLLLMVLIILLILRICMKMNIYLMKQRLFWFN